MIGGWDANPLYIPDIARNIFAILVLFLLMAFQRRLLKDESGSLSFKLVKFTLVVGTFYLIYNWNAIFLQVGLRMQFFISPHYKNFCFTSFTGIIHFTWNNFSDFKTSPYLEIFPFRFLQLGSSCIYLDLVKFPGYVLGGILQIIRTLRNLLRS